MFRWIKQLFVRLREASKHLAVKAVSVVNRAYRICTATRLRRNLSIAVVTTSLTAVLGFASGIFAAAHATVSMGFMGQALIALGSVTLLSVIVAATQFGISTGGGGTLMLYSLATGQYYMTLISALLLVSGFAGLAGLAAWVIAVIMYAPGWLIVALAFCHTNPVIAAVSAVMAIVAFLYVAEFIARLAFKLARKVWQYIARSNLHLLPAPV